MEYFMYINEQKRIYEVSVIKILVKSKILDIDGIKNAIQKTIELSKYF